MSKRISEDKALPLDFRKGILTTVNKLPKAPYKNITAKDFPKFLNFGNFSTNCYTTVSQILEESLLSFLNSWPLRAQFLINLFLIKQYFVGARESRLLKHATDKIYSILGKEKVTFNHHSYGVKTETYTKHKRLRDFFQVISTNIDEYGYEFVSTIEGKGQIEY